MLCGLHTYTYKCLYSFYLTCIHYTIEYAYSARPPVYRGGRSGRKCTGGRGDSVTILTSHSSEYPPSVTTMASVRNSLDPPPQTASNTVIFEMMMHYKRKSEIAEESSRSAHKKLKHARDAIGSLQHELQEQVATNREFARANRRGADIIHRKHQAGMRLVGCLDDLFGAIDLVQDTSLGDDHALGIEFITMHKQAIHGRAETALMLFVEHNDEDLETDETIDLTGEETEEEDVGEWV